MVMDDKFEWAEIEKEISKAPVEIQTPVGLFKVMRR